MSRHIRFHRFFRVCINTEKLPVSEAPPGRVRGGGGHGAHREERGEQFLGDPVSVPLDTEQPALPRGRAPNGHIVAAFSFFAQGK